jgi:hypothetical protein
MEIVAAPGATDAGMSGVRDLTAAARPKGVRIITEARSASFLMGTSCCRHKDASCLDVSGRFFAPPVQLLRGLAEVRGFSAEQNRLTMRPCASPASELWEAPRDCGRDYNGNHDRAFACVTSTVAAPAPQTSTISGPSSVASAACSPGRKAKRSRAAEPGTSRSGSIASATIKVSAH